ncbi:hypothetical protein [Pontixanthobacter aquaemixtae]|uniref:Uncharacterized protein n=1 Tax=Pontixanthobacter aquaemixtae TaxID=1958940 RepID=A0A845A1X5_9SPHN|nr:hypothetical protein [Pontixanthobacter aquaemixtae]MXO91639.1 hypothetical protein [Pontixanthobacter aquaemixtae]
MELHLPGGRLVEISSVENLRTELSLLSRIDDGEAVELKDGTKHSIRAERDDAYWIVTAKPRGWWFRQTLTTGDWIDRSKQKRKPFWVRRGNLTEAKTRKVFVEFFEGKKLSQPVEGAN